MKNGWRGEVCGFEDGEWIRYAYVYGKTLVKMRERKYAVTKALGGKSMESPPKEENVEGRPGEGMPCGVCGEFRAWIERKLPELSNHEECRMHTHAPELFDTIKMSFLAHGNALRDAAALAREKGISNLADLLESKALCEEQVFERIEKA